MINNKDIVNDSGQSPPVSDPGRACPWGPGPVGGHPAPACPKATCPYIPPCPHECPKKLITCLVKRLKPLSDQQVTAYVQGGGPPGPVLGQPAVGITAGYGPSSVTGMLQGTGPDYIEMRVNAATTRVVYAPLAAIGSIVPGGPLEPPVKSAPPVSLPAIGGHYPAPVIVDP